MTLDRKAAIREYKEKPRPMGVYCIRNTVTGRSLVASSVNLTAILNRHRAQLRFGMHPDRELQKDWNDLGEKAFNFEILDTLKPPDQPGYDPGEDLLTLELLWQEKLSMSEGRGYSAKPRPAGT